MHLTGVFCLIVARFVGSAVKAEIRGLSPQMSLSDFDADYRDFNQTADIDEETGGNKITQTPWTDPTVQNLAISGDSTTRSSSKSVSEPWLSVVEIAFLLSTLQVILLIIGFIIFQHLRRKWRRSGAQGEEADSYQFQFSRILD